MTTLEIAIRRRVSLDYGSYLGESWDVVCRASDSDFMPNDRWMLCRGSCVSRREAEAYRDELLARDWRGVDVRRGENPCERRVDLNPHGLI